MYPWGAGKTETHLTSRTPINGRKSGNTTATQSAYVQIPWSKVLLPKLTGAKLVHKLPALYKTGKFFAISTSSPLDHIVTYINSVQHCNPVSEWYISILSVHLWPCIPSGLFPSVFHTKIVQAFLSSQLPFHACLLHSHWLHESNNISRKVQTYFGTLPYAILVNDKLDALFLNVFISTPLHVSSSKCSSSGGPTCIITPSGITH